MPRRRDQRGYDRFQQVAEVPMLILSVVFLVALVLPSVVHLSDSNKAAVAVVEYMIWGVFAVEVIVLAVLAPSWRVLFREHWLDLLIVAAPFLRPLRLTRLLRLVR